MNKLIYQDDLKRKKLFNVVSKEYRKIDSDQYSFFHHQGGWEWDRRDNLSFELYVLFKKLNNKSLFFNLNYRKQILNRFLRRYKDLFFLFFKFLSLNQKFCKKNKNIKNIFFYNPDNKSHTLEVKDFINKGSFKKKTFCLLKLKSTPSQKSCHSNIYKNVKIIDLFKSINLYIFTS